MKYPLQSNIDANVAQRLVQMSCALRDGDLKEAEHIYREIEIRTARGADSDSSLERLLPHDR